MPIIRNDGESIIKGRFMTINNGFFAISVNQKDPGQSTTIIDPVPIRLWATYYGVICIDMMMQVNTDTDGNWLLSVKHSPQQHFNIGSSSRHLVEMGMHLFQSLPLTAHYYGALIMVYRWRNPFACQVAIDDQSIPVSFHSPIILQTSFRYVKFTEHHLCILVSWMTSWNIIGRMMTWYRLIRQ